MGKTTMRVEQLRPDLNEPLFAVRINGAFPSYYLKPDELYGLATSACDSWNRYIDRKRERLVPPQDGELAWTDRSPVPPAPTSSSERCRLCGHDLDWHAEGGGPCEAGPPCECQGYEEDA